MPSHPSFVGQITRCWCDIPICSWLIDHVSLLRSQFATSSCLGDINVSNSCCFTLYSQNWMTGQFTGSPDQFDGKNHGFPVKIFPRKPIHWYTAKPHRVCWNQQDLKTAFWRSQEVVDCGALLQSLRQPAGWPCRARAAPSWWEVSTILNPLKQRKIGFSPQKWIFDKQHAQEWWFSPANNGVFINNFDFSVAQCHPLIITRLLWVGWGHSVFRFKTKSLFLRSVYDKLCLEEGDCMVCMISNWFHSYSWKEHVGGVLLVVAIPGPLSFRKAAHDPALSHGLGAIRRVCSYVDCKHIISWSFVAQKHNVIKTIINHSQFHHVYRWDVNHSQSWVVYAIVLPTLPTCLRPEYCILPNHITVQWQNCLVGPGCRFCGWMSAFLVTQNLMHSNILLIGGSLQLL